LTDVLNSAYNINVIQKQNKNLLPSLDYIILIAVFILAISFAGLLLPFSKTPILEENQENTLFPYSDKTSDESLQLKSVKLNSKSPEIPEEESETCEDKTSKIIIKTVTATPGPTTEWHICKVCSRTIAGQCVDSKSSRPCEPIDCSKCITPTPKPPQTTTTTKPKANFTEEYELN